MAVCPSCKSPNIRNDYKPAPIWLRVLGVRALLCDYCNRQFRAFAPREPRRPRKAKSVTEPPANAADVNLGSLRQDIAAAQSEKAESRDRIKLTVKPDAPGEIVAGQALPVRNDIQTQILKLHVHGAPAKTEGAAQSGSRSRPLCSGCGGENVRRRRRTPFERATLALTGLKAFVCHDCNASFFARLDETANHSDGSGNPMFDSSAFHTGER
jgi:hypothetical protein